MFLSQLSPLILPLLLRDVPAVMHVVTYDAICPLDTKTLPDGSPCRDRPGMACRRNGCMNLLGVARAEVQHGLMRRNLDVFDRIIANSNWVAERLRGDGIRCDGFIWNGIPTRPQRPPLDGPPTVAFAGRLVAKKGVDTLVRALATVRQTVADARLIVAGDGPELPRLKTLAAELGAAEAVEFPGHLSHVDMEPLVARAWVQAVPSLWEEPFGIVVAEAMMRGTAVVATNTGGPVEQVAEGETGLLCPPGDAAAWSAALTRLLNDRGLADRFGTAGRERALRLFTQGRFIDEWEALYRTLTPAK